MGALRNVQPLKCFVVVVLAVARGPDEYPPIRPKRLAKEDARDEKAPDCRATRAACLRGLRDGGQQGRSTSAVPRLLSRDYDERDRAERGRASFYQPAPGGEKWKRRKKMKSHRVVNIDGVERCEDCGLEDKSLILGFPCSVKEREPEEKEAQLLDQWILALWHTLEVVTNEVVQANGLSLVRAIAGKGSLSVTLVGKYVECQPSAPAGCAVYVRSTNNPVMVANLSLAMLGLPPLRMRQAVDVRELMDDFGKKARTT